MSRLLHSLPPVSLPTLFRIGFVLAFLLVLQGLGERLAWRTNGLPFGTNYDPSKERFYIQDFASHLELTKAVLSGAIDRPYTAQGQLQFMERWTGRRVDLALGYGYSPTIWLILSPLLPFPTAAAYVLWTLLPALALLGVGWRLVANGWSERDPLAVALLLVALTSGAYQGEVELGQSTAVLGLITFGLISAASGGRGQRWAPAFLFLLTAKPPLALAMGVGLLWNRQTKPVLLAVGLAVLEAAVITIWLGPRWISDYWELLTHYTSDTAPEAFRAFVSSKGMSNLRALLVAAAGWSDHAASSASVACWAISTAWATSLVLRDRLPAGPLRPAFALALYCVFSPHLTFPNDLMIVIVVWLLYAEGKLDAALRYGAMAAVFVAVNCGPFKLFLLDDTGACLAFLAKLGVLLLFFAAPWSAATARRRVGV